MLYNTGKDSLFSKNKKLEIKKLYKTNFSVIQIYALLSLIVTEEREYKLKQKDTKHLASEFLHETRGACPGFFLWLVYEASMIDSKCLLVKIEINSMLFKNDLCTHYSKQFKLVQAKQYLS